MRGAYVAGTVSSTGAVVGGIESGRCSMASEVVVVLGSSGTLVGGVGPVVLTDCGSVEAVGTVTVVEVDVRPADARGVSTGAPDDELPQLEAAHATRSGNAHRTSRWTPVHVRWFPTNIVRPAHHVAARKGNAA